MSLRCNRESPKGRKFAAGDFCSCFKSLSEQEPPHQAEDKSLSDSPYYDSYIQNFWVCVLHGRCHVDTLSFEKDNRTYTFPITRRYDRDALTQLLLAASMQFNSDYISEGHIFDLVTNAIDSIWYGMRKHNMRKLRPKVAIAT